MGSVGIQNSNPNPNQNQNPFAPYDNYRDCSQGICSIYCPQYCYLIFPPPPPSSDDDSGPPFSPLVIAIVVVLVCAFILASYYTFATRLRNDRAVNTEGAAGEEIRGEESSQDPWGNPPTGLDETLIKRITVCKYQKGDGLIEGTDCAVCLCEFRENESLRLMPKCSHAFHLPCIDTWLKSQSNCPLCRANVVASTPPPLPSSILHMNSSDSQRPDDSVITVTMHDQERNNCDHDDGNEQMVVVVGGDESVETGLRPSTTGTFLPHRHLLISDILKFEEIEEYIEVENDHLWRGTGSSSGRGGELLRSPVASKKIGPGGGFLFGVQDRGKNSVG